MSVSSRRIVHNTGNEILNIYYNADTVFWYSGDAKKLNTSYQLLSKFMVRFNIIKKGLSNKKVKRL